MKSFGILHLFLVLIFIIIWQCAQSQDYLITVKGDSLPGDLKPLTFGADKKVQVTGADKKKAVYPIFQVRQYSYKGDIYQPVKGPAGYTFMKIVKPGYLSLYAFQLENQVTYDGLFLVKKDGTSTEVPNLSFKKIMKNFLADCPSVASLIDDGTLGKKELSIIVDQYNSCIDSKTAAHDRIITKNVQQSKKLNSWDVLENGVKAQADFAGKADALEMIGEIKSKLARAEKIPNFLIEGLKNSLSQAPLKTELENALKDLN